jgi:hypothetical protein
VFLPGVRTASISLMLASGSVTLDAQGNPNAVFIPNAGTARTRKPRRARAHGGAAAPPRRVRRLTAPRFTRPTHRLALGIVAATTAGFAASAIALATTDAAAAPRVQATQELVVLGHVVKILRAGRRQAVHANTDRRLLRRVTTPGQPSRKTSR